MRTPHIQLTEDPIDIRAVEAAVAHPRAGGEVLFVGTTRAWTANPKQTDLPGVETDFLFYEAHETMAWKQMGEIAKHAINEWALLGVAIVHRVGKVLPLEASLAIAVSSPHRAEAFEAARWIIEQIKHDVPIWKQEHYKGAAPEWVHGDSATCCAGPRQDNPPQTC